MSEMYNQDLWCIVVMVQVYWIVVKCVTAWGVLYVGLKGLMIGICNIFTYVNSWDQNTCFINCIQ